MRLSRRLPLVFLVSCLMECEGEAACWRAKQVKGTHMVWRRCQTKCPSQALEVLRHGWLSSCRAQFGQVLFHVSAVGNSTFSTPWVLDVKPCVPVALRALCTWDRRQEAVRTVGAISAVSFMDPSLGFAGFPGEGDSV